MREKRTDAPNLTEPAGRGRPRHFERAAIDAGAATQGPKAAKPRSRAAAVRLAAEVERLAAELQASRERIAKLEAKIDIDPLTETLNRRGFERELGRSLAYVKRYGATAALIYLDLDDFKSVNDRHATPRATRCLRRLPQRLSAACALAMS